MKKSQENILFFDAFTRFGLKPGMHKDQPYELKTLVSEMKHCSISGALVTSSASTLYDPMFENMKLLDDLSKYDNLYAIWNIMPHWTGECPEPDDLFEMLLDHDVKAVTLNPVTNGWNILSETSKPLLSLLQYYRILTILDARTEVDYQSLEFMLQRSPELKILLVGVSWAKQRFILPLLLKYKNLNISFDHFQINNGLEWLVSHGCEDQLIFASNATDMSMGAHRTYIDYADIPFDIKQKIASGNLLHLLKRTPAPKLEINTQEDALMAEVRQGKPLSCEVIDFHSHILHEGLNGAGSSSVMFNGGPKGIKAMADRMGVDRIGIMSWNGTVSAQGEAGNACVMDALKKLPDSYWGLLTFDPVHETPDGLKKKLPKLFSRKRFLGLKPYVTYGLTYDSQEYEEWWKFGNRHHMYALLHPNNADYSEFDYLCPKYPNLTFVAAHCGGSYKIAEQTIKTAKKHKNFYAEITLTPVCLGIIDYLVKGCGADRVLYGSDQPMRDPRQQLGWVVFSKLTLEDKKKVLGGNAKRILDKVKV